MNEYTVIIYWCQEDEIYVAEIPEIKGCLAHGDSKDEALREIDLVAAEWLKLAAEKGWEIPEPKGRLLFA